MPENAVVLMKEIQIKILALFFISAILVGCKSARPWSEFSDGVMLNVPAGSDVTPVSKKPEEVQVADTSNTNKQFVVIGIAEANAPTLSTAVTLLRKEAAKMGGDAIIDIVPNGAVFENLGLPLEGDIFLPNRDWIARVVCWTNADQRPASSVHSQHAFLAKPR